MLKAKNIIISIITMTAVLFTIVMIPNTAMADEMVIYAMTDEGLKKMVNYAHRRRMRLLLATVYLCALTIT